MDEEQKKALRELLAEQQHEIWAHWMKYLYEQCIEAENGDGIIPYEYVARWARQIKTPYVALSEKEKESDREQADKIIKLLEMALNI